jgi:hypothetical protein
MSPLAGLTIKKRLVPSAYAAGLHNFAPAALGKRHLISFKTGVNIRACGVWYCNPRSDSVLS